MIMKLNIRPDSMLHSTPTLLFIYPIRKWHRRSIKKPMILKTVLLLLQ